MSDIEAINQVLTQIKAMKQRAQNAPEVVANSQALSFPDTLRQAVDKVNDMQQTSIALKTRFEKGDTQVALSDVMIAAEKSGLAFDAAVQIRNRVVQAYQDIMNMPI